MPQNPLDEVNFTKYSGQPALEVSRPPGILGSLFHWHEIKLFRYLPDRPEH